MQSLTLHSCRTITGALAGCDFLKIAKVGPSKARAFVRRHWNDDISFLQNLLAISDIITFAEEGAPFSLTTTTTLADAVLTLLYQPVLSSANTVVFASDPALLGTCTNGKTAVDYIPLCFRNGSSAIDPRPPHTSYYHRGGCENCQPLAGIGSDGAGAPPVDWDDSRLTAPSHPSLAQASTPVVSIQNILAFGLIRSACEYQWVEEALHRVCETNHTVCSTMISRLKQPIGPEVHMVYVKAQVDRSFLKAGQPAEYSEGRKDKAQRHYDVRLQLETRVSDGKEVLHSVVAATCHCDNHPRNCVHKIAVLISLFLLGSNSAAVGRAAARTTALQSAVVTMKEIFLSRLHGADAPGNQMSCEGIHQLTATFGGCLAL